MHASVYVVEPHRDGLRWQSRGSGSDEIVGDTIVQCALAVRAAHGHMRPGRIMLNPGTPLENDWMEIDRW